ncbi:bacteriocin immunity protein [Laceyella putida]|uniref:Bacteriocin immunity protein n=1 Tax=Laceyella putida TaxID=110101 RepID=A0ABW2RQC7_9BACL
MDRVRTKEELIELVRKIVNAEGTEEELDEMLDLLERRVPHPEVSDLIYWDERNLTPEEIVEEALDYQSIITPPPSNETKK